MSENLIFFVGPFLVSLFCLLILRGAKRTNFQWYKDVLFITSGKSESDAQLIGGLPICISVVAWIVYAKLSASFSTISWPVVSAFIFGTVFITIYGYLDDRYELRPIVKLAAQFIVVNVFSIVAAVELGNEFSTFLFITTSFYGMGTLNGTNLLDGLDTMSIKLSTVIYMSFIFMGFHFNSQTTLIAGTIFVSALLPFWFFNKYPSKIHLGEIGGAYIGFSYIFLFSTMFVHLAGRLSVVNSFIYSLLPLTIPMAEVSISFVRRIANGKSPFKGDRFHLHHLLRNYYGLSVNMTTIILAYSYGTFIFSSLLLTTYFDLAPIVSFVSLCVMTAGFQLFFGKRYWVKSKLGFSLNNMLTSLRKKDLTIIDSSKVDRFEFKVITNAEHAEDEERDDKKAA